MPGRNQKGKAHSNCLNDLTVKSIKFSSGELLSTGCVVSIVVLWQVQIVLIFSYGDVGDDNMVEDGDGMEWWHSVREMVGLKFKFYDYKGLLSTNPIS